MSLGDRIRLARKKKGMVQRDLAAHFGIATSAVGQWETDATLPDSQRLPELSRLLGVSLDWLASDSPDSTLPELLTPTTMARADTIPVLGTAEGGGDGAVEWNGEVVDRVARPPFLSGATSAYAVFCRNDSMWPRYIEGELIYVHPGRPVTPNCFVVVQIPDGYGKPAKAWIKQFVRRTATKLVLRQFNPKREFDVPLPVFALHRIVGSGES